MKKAYNLSEELCHFEPVLKSLKTLKQVQGDSGVVQGDNKRHSELVSESQGTLKLARTQFLTLALKEAKLHTSLVRLVPCLRYWQVQGDRIKAFTLAEIMIVLSVIAVLTAILLPAARNAMPNEEVLKFKKTHNALTSAIREMVNSDKYFLDGDLTKKPDGSPANTCYQAHALADILNAQVLDCKDDITPTGLCIEVNDEMDDIKSADTNCDSGYSISRTVMNVETEFFSFSTIKLQNGAIVSYFPPNGSCIDSQGFNASYGVAHILQKETSYDIDNDGELTFYDAVLMLESCTNNTEEKIETFTYLVRSDGKIITSSKVDEWLERDVQDKT